MLQLPGKLRDSNSPKQSPETGKFPKGTEAGAVLRDLKGQVIT